MFVHCVVSHLVNRLVPVELERKSVLYNRIKYSDIASILIFCSLNNLVLKEEILLKSIYTILPKFSYTDT